MNKIGFNLVILALIFFPLMLLFIKIDENHNGFVAYIFKVWIFMLVYIYLWAIVAFVIYKMMPCLLSWHFYRVLRFFLVSFFILFGLFSYNQSLILGACIAYLFAYRIFILIFSNPSLKSFRFKFDTICYTGIIAIIWYGFWFWYYKDSYLQSFQLYLDVRIQVKNMFYLAVCNIMITFVFSLLSRRLCEYFR